MSTFPASGSASGISNAMRLRHRDIQRFNTVIARMYEQAFLEGPLPAIANALSKIIDCAGAVAEAEPRKHRTNSATTLPDFLAMMTQLPGDITAWHPCAALRLGKVVGISDVLETVQWRRRDAYQWAMPVLRFEDDIGTALRMEDGGFFRACAVTDRRIFGESEKAIFRLLLPHLRTILNATSARAEKAGRTPRRTGCGTIVLHRERLQESHIPKSVCKILQEAFPGCAGLPGEIAAWVTSVRDRRSLVDEPMEGYHVMPFDTSRFCGIMEYVPASESEPERLLVRWEPRWAADKKAPATGAGGLGLLHDSRPLKPLGLSRREEEVLFWVAAGKTNNELAQLLDISPGTARRHLENIYPKLGVENRFGAIRAALELMA